MVLQNILKLDGFSSVGICCPDSGTKTATPNFGSRLPAIGSNYDSQIDSEVDNLRDIKPETRGCGVSKVQVGKITGGIPAQPGKWPWMAALISNMAHRVFCGGVLITDRHVLTAAHCVTRLKPREFRIRLGEYDFSRLNETRTRDFAVLEVRLHIDFDVTK